MLTSRSPPEAKSQAVKPLIRMPSPATTIIVVLATGGGAERRCTASQEIAPAATSNKTALASAARIVDEPNPYVYCSVGRRLTRTLAPQAINRHSTSLRLWPASASSAIELAD